MKKKSTMWNFSSSRQATEYKITAKTLERNLTSQWSRPWPQEVPLGRRWTQKHPNSKICKQTTLKSLETQQPRSKRIITSTLTADKPAKQRWMLRLKAKLSINGPELEARDEQASDKLQNIAFSTSNVCVYWHLQAN